MVLIYVDNIDVIYLFRWFYVVHVLLFKCLGSKIFYNVFFFFFQLPFLQS